MKFPMNLLIALIAYSGNLVIAGEKLTEQLGLISLPPGFEIHLYAEGVKSARQLALADHGVVFVGSPKAGKIYAVVDSDGDQVADRVYLIDENLNRPSGLEFRDGALFVAAVDRIFRYDGIESHLEDPPEPVLLSTEFPDKTRHARRYLRFGPDGKLYVPVGAPCNICNESGFAQIRRISVDGSDQEIYVEGVRNSVGLAFHPDNGELWFTDNGRDLLGDDIPADELNHAPHAGMHFGYPWCHQGDMPDPEFGRGKTCTDYTPPALKLGAHVAALGLMFYTGSMFPSPYHNQLFIAQHGSWKRSVKVGCNIILVRFDAEGDVLGQELFASGWLQGDECWGRPNDVLQMPDRSLLVADDKAGSIYRISYQGKQ